MTSPPSQPVARGLFVATILVGSFLLFLVQPMVARMALPRLGGAPNVWNSAMLVYQALLLTGYAYAHRLSGLAPGRQAAIHLALLALCALTLPIMLAQPGAFAPGWEVLWVPLLLLLTVGPVFFAVSAQAPLMQRWFSSHPSAGEPWALYAASNLGSFDVLAIDAFSSGAIPLHLITREAVEVYLRSVARDGLVVLHISNRFIELEPVVAAIARDLGLAARVRNDDLEDRGSLTPSAWVALARDPAMLEALARRSPDAAWVALAAPAERAWTDDRASVLPAIRWDRLPGNL